MTYGLGWTSFGPELQLQGGGPRRQEGPAFRENIMHSAWNAECDVMMTVSGRVEIEAITS